jgi:hypothetical protein
MVSRWRLYIAWHVQKDPFLSFEDVDFEPEDLTIREEFPAQAFNPPQNERKCSLSEESDDEETIYYTHV